MLFDDLFMLILFFRDLLKELLFGQIPILPILFKLLLNLLLFDVLAPVYLRFFNAIYVLSLVIDETN